MLDRRDECWLSRSQLGQAVVATGLREPMGIGGRVLVVEVGVGEAVLFGGPVTMRLGVGIGPGGRVMFGGLVPLHNGGGTSRGESNVRRVGPVGRGGHRSGKG